MSSPSTDKPRKRSGGGKSRATRAPKDSTGPDDPGFTAGSVNPNIRRPKQEPLIDVAPEVHPAVQAAAEDYVETLDQRIALQQLEPDKRDYLIEMMKKHNCRKCIVQGKTVELEKLYKIKTKKMKEVE